MRSTGQLVPKTTRAGVIVDPQSIQHWDLNTGSRPKAFSPDTGGSPKTPEPTKPQRVPFQKIPRNNTERKGFTGGT